MIREYAVHILLGDFEYLLNYIKLVATIVICK